MAFKITVSANLPKITKNLVKRQQAVEAETLRYLQDIKDNAQAQWPVDTGASRAAFRVTVTTAQGRRVFRLINPVGYARFINRGVTVRRLVVDPFNAGMPLLVKRIAKKLAGV